MAGFNQETTAEPTRHDTARISEEDQESTLAETTRLEAFSDGAFAIIITLLVLEIHRSNSATGHLAAELLKAWPSYLAYAVAFLYVGVIWLNHQSSVIKQTLEMQSEDTSATRDPLKKACLARGVWMNS